VTSTTALKRFCWDRWTAAEKALSRTTYGTKAYSVAETRTEFWRKAFNAYEAREADETHRDRLDELAVAVREDSFPVFHRVPEEKLPETYPDIPALSTWRWRKDR
jgi:hypothetical protein